MRKAAERCLQEDPSPGKHKDITTTSFSRHPLVTEDALQPTKRLVGAETHGPLGLRETDGGM